MKIGRRAAALLMAAAILASLTAAYAEDDGYVPLRAAFEEKGYVVDWCSELPDDIFVRAGDQLLVFTNHSSAVATDEGIFHTARETYIADGTTYISRDAVELVENIHLYHSAIQDCETMEESELCPLRPLDAAADRVLLCTWHKYPGSYPDGAEITLRYGDVWTTAAEEILGSGDLGSGDAFVLRMEQLLGLPPQNGKTHFTLMWVKPEDIFRPAPDRAIGTTGTPLAFPDGTDDAYRQWFHDQQQYSYVPHRFPWTGLGYTYDWADNGTEYGFSEYIVKSGSVVTVEKTYTNEEFEAYLRQQGVSAR